MSECTEGGGAALGLRKLAEFLAQTRRQATTSIDALNERIAELTAELEVSQAAAEQLQSERDFYLNHAEQLKLENSKKWRLQERDDWKSLVDSVQQDRTRLQDECHRLETALEEAQGRVAALQQQQQQRAPLSPVSSTSRFFFGSPLTIAAPSSSSGLSPDSADGDASSSLINGNTATPRAMAKQLKLELTKAQANLHVVRASAEATAQSQESEIGRLRQELDRARRSRHSSGAVWARGAGGAGGRVTGATGGYHYREPGWYDPLGLLNFFLSGSSAKKELTGVLHV